MENDERLTQHKRFFKKCLSVLLVFLRVRAFTTVVFSKLPLLVTMTTEYRRPATSELKEHSGGEELDTARMCTTRCPSLSLTRYLLTRPTAGCHDTWRASDLPLLETVTSETDAGAAKRTSQIQVCNQRWQVGGVYLKRTIEHNPNIRTISFFCECLSALVFV